jgi:hypothetical protein
MPSRKEENQLIVREKALNTRVYVSGLRGDHNLETGLAYYYRGHYLYSFPGGALIEPIPYSTKKGIMVHGMVSPSAPTYDGSSARLVPEESIRALKASIKNELGSRESRPALDQAGGGGRRRCFWRIHGPLAEDLVSLPAGAECGSADPVACKSVRAAPRCRQRSDVALDTKFHFPSVFFNLGSRFFIFGFIFSAFGSSSFTFGSNPFTSDPNPHIHSASRCHLPRRLSTRKPLYIASTVS